MAITNPALAEYADRLRAAGFTVYEPKGHGDRHFGYSRVVDGKECFGFVQSAPYSDLTHTMPIKPSKEHGSSMWVDGAEDLSIESAEKIASPSNWNEVVGTHANYWVDSLNSYNRLEPTK